MTPSASIRMSESSTDKSLARDGAESPISKALVVLDAVAQSSKPLRFMALCKQLPYPKATLHRLLRLLTEERMLLYDSASQTYRAGSRLIRMAYASWNSSGLVESASPVMDRLSKSIPETLELAQLDGGQVLYLDRRTANVTSPSFSGAGKVGPAYCTAIGKAMLSFLDDAALAGMLPKQAFHRFTPNTPENASELAAELDDTRARGFAVEREEHEYGVIAVAVPIRLSEGPLYGALSLTGTVYHTSPEALESHLPALKAAAQEIARGAQMRMTRCL